MGDLVRGSRPTINVNTRALLAWCLSFFGLLFLGNVIVGNGTSSNSGTLSLNPNTLWPVSVEGDESIQGLSLKIPMLIGEQLVPPDSTITYSVSFATQDVEQITHPSVMLVRPLHNASVTWDGVEVPLHSADGGSGLLSDTSLLGVLPVVEQHEEDNHILTITLTGAHGYLGITKSVIVGELRSLQQSLQYGELRMVFGATVLLIIGVVLLLIGLYSKHRALFISTALISVTMGLTVLTFADLWSVLPWGLEARLRVRHAVICLNPFFGLLALNYILQERPRVVLLLLGCVSVSLSALCIGWPDSTILPNIRQFERVIAALCLAYGLKISFKPSIQGVFEARVVMGVVLAMLFAWVLALQQYSILGDGSLLVLVFVGVSGSLAVLVFSKYLTSSERYAQLVSEASDAIMVVETNGTVVESNATGLLLLGGGLVSKEVRVNLFERVDPIDVDLCHEHLVGLAGRVVLRFPSNIGDEGEVRVVFVESVSIALDDSQSLLVLRDVSQRSQIEDRIVSSVRMETLGIVARGIAHDYNNTLSAVLGQLTMLGHEVPSIDTALIRRIEQIIVDTSVRTRKQLAIVRGGSEPSRSVDPIDLVESTSQLIIGTLPDNVFLTKSFGDDLPSVYCKAVEIEQVLLNLVTNARDALANEERGEIEIRAERAAGNFVLFSVTRNGPAIPPEQAHLVWSPFFSSLDSGFILSVVQRVVREHGGRVRQVTPESGVGARFEVYIPTADAIALSEPSVTVSKPCEVLVVEDEPNIREVMVSTLRLRGFTVAQAQSAEEARERFEPGEFQLLVTDVIMGAENGINLAKYYTKKNPELAVLVVSGQVPEKLHASDNWAFLDKPFTPEMLVAAARTAILLSKVSVSEGLNE